MGWERVRTLQGGGEASMVRTPSANKYRQAKSIPTMHERRTELKSAARSKNRLGVHVVRR